MSKGSSTRSGLLWEVERILDECKEIGNLPQILLMENVPQVIGSKNINDFQNWEQKLESLGYSNYIEKLNSKEYLIPQNRDRCFMISILGDYSYNFPTKKKLGIRLKDVLENNVDESYYLSDKIIDFYCQNSIKQQKNCLLTNSQNNLVAIQLIPFGSYYTWKDNKGNINTQCNRASDENGCSLTIPTIPGLTKVLETEKLRIRKLTPKECFRLMGVKDEDYNNVAINQSDASLYHLAGDSIVTSCLMGIFGELLEIDWKTKVDEVIEDIVER